MLQHALLAGDVASPVSKPRKPKAELTPEQKLRDALAPYLDLRALRTLASEGKDIREAIIATGELPQEVQAMIEAVSVVLRPTVRQQIKSPADVAAFLMAEMGTLDQEELRVLCLDTKNRIQKVQTVYKGSVNSAMIRVGEVFKEALRLNSTAIIVVHNHPSSDISPSPEDILVTRQIVDAGKLLDVEVVDHLIIGQGRWTSLRERGLGFPK